MWANGRPRLDSLLPFPEGVEVAVIAADHQQAACRNRRSMTGGAELIAPELAAVEVGHNDLAMHG